MMKMTDCGQQKEKKTICRTLQRGVGWFAGVIALAMMLTACGGGDGGQPPLAPAASLSGTVTFTAAVPLDTPPSDAFDGPVPPDVRYGARIIDPGDDIGGTPIPKPNNMTQTGSYEFEELDTEALTFLNLRFTIDGDLEDRGNDTTPVSINIPVSLAKSFLSMLNCSIDRPSENVLQITYNYRGPDGSRVIKLRLDFATDLLTFDLDADGLYDDLIAIDTNHDAIPDIHSPLMVTLDYTAAQEVVGKVTGVGSNTITISGGTYAVWGSTNIVNSASGTPVSLSEVSTGMNATVSYVPFNGNNIAVTITIQPDPSAPQPGIGVRRDGAIEGITSETILVSGVMFHDYGMASIKNELGNSIGPGELKVGEYVTILGNHVDDRIVATAITVTDVAPPPVRVERQGVIQSLDPEENPTSMRVADLSMLISPQTVVEDISGAIADTSYLAVGNPVHVYAHGTDGTFTADLIEFQYVIEDGAPLPEVIVVYNDPSALGEIQAAIGQVDTDTRITPILVATDNQLEPPCIQDAFNALYTSEGSIEGLPGYIMAFPRVSGDECVVLILIEDGYNITISWIDWLYPSGLGTGPYVPIEYDNVSRSPFYGAGEKLTEALSVEDELTEILNPDPAGAIQYVYTSPEIGFE
jgi:hypothetical protein